MKKIKLLSLACGMVPLSIISVLTTSCSCGGGEQPKPETQFTVTFSSTEGGTLIGEKTIKVKEGTKWSEITKPEVQTKDDYLFVGWYSNNKIISDDYKITSDFSAVATFLGVTPKSSFNFLYNDVDKTASIEKYKGNETDVIIPKQITSGNTQYTVTSIEDSGFSSTPVVNVWMTSSIKTLGKSCFDNCNKLQFIYLSDSITALPENCFGRCNDLEEIEIKENISSIGKECFISCDKLNNVTFNTEYEWEIGTGNYWQPSSNGETNAFALRNFDDLSFTRKDKTKANFCDATWDKLISHTTQELKETYGRESFVGLLKTIKFNNQDLWVRVIGQEHDTIASSNAKAALTFELINVVCDKDGKFLSTQWNQDSSTTNHDYTTSTLYKALNAPESEKVIWYENSSIDPSETYQQSCLTTLKKENSELASGLKTVTKQVAKYSTDKYEVVNYDTILFPLSIKEMGQSSSCDEGSTYNYWSNHKEKSDYIKKDLIGNIRDSWLLSPSTEDEEFAWCISSSQAIYETMLDSFETTVTFGFCI